MFLEDLMFEGFQVASNQGLASQQVCTHYVVFASCLIDIIHAEYLCIGTLFTDPSLLLPPLFAAPPPPCSLLLPLLLAAPALRPSLFFAAPPLLLPLLLSLVTPCS